METPTSKWKVGWIRGGLLGLSWVLPLIAAAQGVVETTPGLGFDTRSLEVAFEAGVPAPTLQLRLGFGTDEIASAGVIPDAFSLTVQESGSAPRTFLLATFDSGGVVWAPPTPGIEALPPDNLLWAPIAAPPELAGLGQVHSYYLEVLLPPTLAGRPLQVHFDLFNNDNGVPSRGWYSAVEAVPEPSLGALLAVGILALGWVRRLGRPARDLGRTLGVMAGWGWLALALVLATAGGTGTVHAQDKTFQLYGTDLVLGERSADVEVFYRSMRFNRALNVWNVEVVITNTSGRALKGPLILLVDSVEGSSGVVGPDGMEDSQPAKSFFDLSAAAGDGVLSAGEVTVARTITLGPRANEPPALRTKFYAGRDPVVAALGVTRSLDAAGRPLPDVAVTLSGPVTTAQQTSDRDSGVVSFGQGAGEHRLRFDRTGYLPVWRRMTLAPEAPRVLPNPRLTPRSGSPVGITPLGGQVVSNASGSVEIEFAAGAVREAGPVTLTSLTGQTLPAFLPLGWSPLSAFWIESAVPFGAGVRAGLVPEGGARAGESLVLVRWNDTQLQWDVSAPVVGDGTNRVFAALEAAGAYALVVADAGVDVPTLTPGQPLPGLAVPVPEVDGLSARGTVQPAASPASLDPEQVTGQARLEVRHAGARLPSGLLLRGEVTETYLLKDGSLRLTPQYEHFVVGYQRPGDADPNTLHATFPMRPQLLFGPDQLETASVKVDLLPEQPFDGQVLDAAGGQIGVQGVRLVAGNGQLTGPSALRLRRLDGSVFETLMTASNAVVGAFELTVDASTVSDPLAARLGGAPGNSRFVLARVLSDVGFYGLQPVERLVSDAAGNLSSAEPATGERLPGLRGSGQFVLVQVDGVQVLVSGIARNGAGQVQGRMPVSLVGLPWLALTDDQGRYQLVGPEGDLELSVRDPLTGDAGVVAVRIQDGGATLSQDLGTAPAGPRVTRITPANEATRVPRVGSVVIEFNEAVNPATVVGPAIQLIRPDDSVVPTALTLNLRGTVATLSPATELDANTQYRVRLAATIADPTGLPLEGPSEFRFTTVPASTRIATAQLVIYEPGATDVPAAILDDIPAFTPGQDPSAIVVHGQPGVADPGVPVILVNESTGETQTVLSQPDGSFSSFITGTEQDFVSATFVNLNGTRVYVPVSRQEFDNGFVGLYPQGGILEAQSDGGPVQVQIAPSAIPNRTKFKLETLRPAQLQALLEGTSPEAGTIAAAALNLRIDGPAPTLPLQVRFPVDLAALGYPSTEAPTNAAAVVAVVRDTDGVKTFEVMDQLLFTPGTSPSPAPRPAGRVRRASGDNEQIAAGFLDTSVGLMMPALGPAALPIQIGFNQVLIPLLFGPRPVVVKGKVAALPYDLAVALQQAGVFNQVANLQTGVGSVDVPFSLAQTMGFFDFGLAIGTAQSVVNVAYTTFQQQALVASRPLSGAFVSLSLSGGPLRRQPGRLFPGMVYATSGADGYFLTVAPAAGANYLMTATHPRFQEVQTESVNPISVIPGQQGDLSLAGVVFKNFYFQVPTQTETPPTISIATEPVQPVAGQPTRLVVMASQPTVAPDITVKVRSIGRTNLLTGRVETNVISSLENVIITQVGTSTRWTATFTVDKPVLADLQVNVVGEHFAQDAFIPYRLAFTGPQPPLPSIDIPAPDTNDVHGPLVVEVLPSDNGFVLEDGRLVISFNKPIDASVTNNVTGISLDGPGAFVTPIVRLSRDQRTLTLQYPGLAADQTYTLTLSGQSIRDLAAQPLDQRPSTPEMESFSMTFRTPPKSEAPIPGLVNGKGAVISGDRLYVIEQGPPAHQLVVYDVSTPLDPKFVSRVPLVGQPRDLAVIPNFAYRRSLRAEIETNDLVAVVGGELDALVNQTQGTTVSVDGQYLWVVAMTESGGTPEVIASPVVTYRVSSVVSKVRWVPPYLVYQEYGQDVQFLGLVNLQELIIGYGSTPAERATFPTPPRRNEVNSGQDFNGDGDYVDENETVPIPDLNPVEFYGKRRNVALENTTQKILDFSVLQRGAYVGVTLRNGVILDARGRPTGPPVPPMYRTLFYGGLPMDLTNPLDSAYHFDPTAYPRWVTLANSLPIEIDGVRTTIAAAVVSLQPDSDGEQKLAVINISVPQQPRLINKIAIPEDLLGGGIQSVAFTDDRLLAVAGARNLLLLDPSKLAITNAPANQPHPAVLALVPNAGAGSRSLGSTDFGVRAVAEGGRGVVVQSPPTLQFVSFPNQSELVIPTELAGRADEDLASALRAIRPTVHLAPARVRPDPTVSVVSDLEPTPNPALHFYVYVTAPGAAGPEIELGLESLNPAGRPLSNPGFGFAPVRAVSDATQDGIGQKPRESCGAPIRSLPAYRLSNDPNSEFYNRYLSRAFVLVTEALTPDELTRLKVEMDREVLFSGASLRAFIEPGQATHAVAGPVLGPFAARIDVRRKQIFPISVGSAITINRDYLVGDNPPPTGGADPMEDTYGAIQAHSGEVRTTDVDLSIPSPRMPVSILRTIGNQDTYEGPFGVGWDFNYNQRLTLLDPLTFPEGLQLPLVVRATAEESEIAGSRDVLFNNGEGAVMHFRWMGTNMPPEYAEDPLVTEFDYKSLVADYYLPQRGVFNLLVRFKDGRFERMTPDGKRYRYSVAGRLETIIDTFPLNRHELQYDRNGWLVRIDDRSVNETRYIELGHYRRRPTDPDFVAGLDEDTFNSYHEGLICRLRDHTGRDVLFEYDDQGFLVRRLDVEVDGANGGFSGRAKTIYTYKDCRLASISATADGTPYIAADSTLSQTGEPVAQASSGSYGNAQMTIPVENSAKTVGSQRSSVTVGDGTKVEREFDSRGNLKSTTVSGAAGDSVSIVRTNTPDGRVAFVRYPEGNSETMTYDSDNRIFRSRGNLLSRQVDPGPRGGAGYTETHQYDPRYNLMSGVQRDANGSESTYSLTGDGRAVQSIDYSGDGRQEMAYNSKGQLVFVRDETGAEERQAFSETTGFTESVTYGSIIYRYEYDGSRASKLGRPARISPPEGEPTEMKYSDRMEVVETKRGPLVERTAYDEVGRPIRIVSDVGDGKRLTASRRYDDKGFMTEMTLDGVDVMGSVGTITTRFHPDKRSRLQSTVHANGTSQEYTYDSRGNVTKMSFGDYEEEYDYDLNNNLLSLKQGGDVVKTYEYDGLDRPIRIVRRTGSRDYVQTRTFRPGGELLADSLVDPDFGLLRSTSYGEIDALGRHLKVSVQGNVISPEYTYEYAPLQSKVIGPRMTATSTWDTAGLPATYSDPNQTTVLHRDTAGQTIQFDSREDGATYSQTYVLDPMGYRQRVIDALGVRFEYASRADGNQTRITNARGNAVTLEHTALGELQRKRRPDGMEMQQKRDVQRQVRFKGEPDVGFNFEYDGSLRLTRQTLRNGASMQFEGFDPRSMPTDLTLPGGTETRQYDLQRRLTQRRLAYQSTVVEEAYTYDGLDRVRSVTYSQNGGPANTAAYDYDPAGPLLATRIREDGQEFSLAYGYYEDGGRKTITYPSGVVVTEVRDAAGRLTGITDANGNIVTATEWKGNSEPAVLQLGTTMRVENQYDARGRLTGSRTIRTADQAVLSHLRYQYDPANNISIRQFVHRGGRADVFGFDTAERVAQAKVGVVVTNDAGLGPVLYGRQYRYHSAGRDYLESVVLSGIGPRAPPFATNWSGHDEFLLPALVNGFNRGSADPKGNVAAAQLWVRTEGEGAAEAVPATLEYDGFGRLIRVSRSDGVTVEHQYQPGGLRFSTKVTQGGTVLRHSAHVYDVGGRLLEEYDRTVTPARVTARYYYGSGDAPLAADLRDSDGGALRRYYFLTDVAMSVVAVAEADGTVVERVWYDPFGQPQIERRDTQPPSIRSIQAAANGSLLVALTESVIPAFTDPGPGSQIVSITNLFGGALSLVDLASNAPVEGTVSWEADLPGFAPYSVLRFQPERLATGAVSLTLVGGAVSDEWGNTNLARSVRFTNSGPVGTVYFDPQPALDTSPVPLARSEIGSPFLFHGQYFDYDSGLIYLRARYYDPYSGMFFQPDPLGYEDSVNHYAGLGNNPVSYRDPSGLRIKGVSDAGYHAYLNKMGYTAGEMRLLTGAYEQLKNLGMGDLEIAAHVRVMYQEYHQHQRTWEIAIRSFGDKAEVRIDRIDEFHQTKEEKVVVKTQEDGLAYHEGEDNIPTGEKFAGDLDGLYAKLNGKIASIDALSEFQGKVNAEVARLSDGWRDLAREGGQTIHGNAIQKAYQHGFSLNIPQEVGTAHKLSKGGFFGYDAIEMINIKMKKGIGEAFSLKFDPDKIAINDKVDVDRAVVEHENYYKRVLLNPNSSGFNRQLYRQRLFQARRDGRVHSMLFPLPFYIRNRQ